MDIQLLIANLTNPPLLYFLLGILAVRLKSDLEIPESTSKFIALYLLFAIGFKGGQELTAAPIGMEVWIALGFGVVLATVVPIYVFYLLKRKMRVPDAGAVAAAYGSVSAVTFVAAVAFLEAVGMPFGGHMVAVLALMEAPAIIAGVVLMMRYDAESRATTDLGHVVRHAFTNGSVLMVLGSLAIGFIAETKQAEGIKPFTTDIFKGFLALFLLEMGMVTARRFGAFLEYGRYALLMGLVLPLVNGTVTAWLSGFLIADPGDRFLFAVLAASASYIAVPAAMRMVAPKADPGLYIPMALGVTFPFNLTLGMPLFWWLVTNG